MVGRVRQLRAWVGDALLIGQWRCVLMECVDPRGPRAGRTVSGISGLPPLAAMGLRRGEAGPISITRPELRSAGHDRR
jgi:hypothetical protein